MAWPGRPPERSLRFPALSRRALSPTADRSESRVPVQVEIAAQLQSGSKQNEIIAISGQSDWQLSDKWVKSRPIRALLVSHRLKCLSDSSRLPSVERVFTNFETQVVENHREWVDDWQELWSEHITGKLSHNAQSCVGTQSRQHWSLITSKESATEESVTGLSAFGSDSQSIYICV